MRIPARLFKTALIQGLLLSALILSPSVSMAVLQDEIQVYDDEINAKGEASLEVHLNSTPRGIQNPSYPGEVMNNNGVRVTPEFAYGLGHDLEAGLYISYVNYDNKFQYAATKVRMKWLPIREDKGDSFFAGANLELSNVQPQFDESRYNGEMRFIVGKHFDEWLLSFNPIVDMPLSQPYVHQSPYFSTATRLSREVTPELALGVEYYSNLNQLGQPINYQNTQQLGFLMMYYEGKPLSFQAGVGKGFSNSTDSLTLKAIFSIPLN
ncbi:transporter [Polynucleobacter sp. Ross1-W9]|uniref:transporter n=1 Tax=Polynucleobacter parvulilacunae TaxID=1855631 RepID=UPI001C0BCD84|nr:transporter [Polynucleobacter parvulilacunae]MBU3557552.1 transporter [Polynucleobacter parvulilacunae]